MMYLREILWVILCRELWVVSCFFLAFQWGFFALIFVPIFLEFLLDLVMRFAGFYVFSVFDVFYVGF